ncbi:MAG: bifunctional adenosylcobinamide kinase/adenosylcobinamide-phosphate guanylyltransferase [Lachnospiraceae bacterium]|nr:bifunctional adenosylcobinamide kinase/adenosylcobinamide-phosphate guanylyltransferase [Lachnospiraceae bacterium]
MEVYIGGYAQGKLAYVKQVHQEEDFCVVEDCHDLPREQTDRLVLYGMHRMIRELLEEGQDPQAFFEEVFDQYPDCIVICDEVGNGIVPADQKEREYRDKVGEILIIAAEKADRVERVICGLGQRIK